MPFTVSEYLDLVRLLGERPEWRAELRRLLLSEEVLELPRLVHELAAAQQRTEVRLEELAAAQQRTEVRLEELAAAQQRTEARLEELTIALHHVEDQIRDLVAVQKEMLGDLAELKGWALESRYREHAYGFFGRWLRKAQVVSMRDLARIEEAYEQGQLTEDEWEQLTALDLLIQGRVGKGEEARDVLLALEVSWVIDIHDVERAHQRAAILRRLGYPAIGGVGGKGSMRDAEERAEELRVVVAVDGRARYFPNKLPV